MERSETPATLASVRAGGRTGDAQSARQTARLTRGGSEHRTRSVAT